MAQYQPGEASETDAELRQLRRELERVTAQLERHQRRKSSLLAMAAHDLRTPLAIIQGYAQLLAGEPAAQTDTTADYINNIVSHSDLLGKMVENLITLDQVDRRELRLAPGRNDLAELVDQAIAQVEGLTKLKEVTVEYAGIGAPVWVMADVEQIDRVLYNLLSHAIKYARPGARVRVEVDRMGSFGRARLTDPQRHLKAELLTRLFDLPELNRDGAASLRGMDMGLVLAHRVAEAHGGTVEASSEPEQGMSLTLLLPEAGD